MYISLYSSPHPRYIAWMYAEKCRTIFITFLFFSFFDLQWLKMKDLNKSFSQERNWTMWQNYKTSAQSVTLWIVWFLNVTCLILLTSKCLDRNYVAFGVWVLLFLFFFFFPTRFKLLETIITVHVLQNNLHHFSFLFFFWLTMIENERFEQKFFPRKKLDNVAKFQDFGTICHSMNSLISRCHLFDIAYKWVFG